MKYFALLPFISQISAGDGPADADGLIRDGTPEGRCLDIVSKSWVRNHRRNRREVEEDDDFNMDDFVPFLADDIMSLGADDVSMFKRNKGNKNTCNQNLKLIFTNRCNEESDRDESVAFKYNWQALRSDPDDQSLFKIESRYEKCLDHALTVGNHYFRKRRYLMRMGPTDTADYFYQVGNMMYVHGRDGNLVVGNDKKTGKVIAIPKCKLPNTYWGTGEEAEECRQTAAQAEEAAVQAEVDDLLEDGWSAVDNGDSDGEAEVDEEAVANGATGAAVFQLFYENNLTWYEARDRCIAHGASLAAIYSDAEKDLVHALGASQVAWIGANDINSEGSWRWIQGANVADEHITYNGWRSGEPNNSGNEDCAEKYLDGEWNDIACSSRRHAYICQKRF